MSKLPMGCVWTSETLGLKVPALSRTYHCKGTVRKASELSTSQEPLGRLGPWSPGNFWCCQFGWPMFDHQEKCWKMGKRHDELVFGWFAVVQWFIFRCFHQVTFHWTTVETNGSNQKVNWSTWPTWWSHYTTANFQPQRHAPKTRPGSQHKIFQNLLSQNHQRKQQKHPKLQELLFWIMDLPSQKSHKMTCLNRLFMFVPSQLRHRSSECAPPMEPPRRPCARSKRWVPWDLRRRRRRSWASHGRLSLVGRGGTLGGMFGEKYGKNDEKWL